jgi:hypothetical protein
MAEVIELALDVFLPFEQFPDEGLAHGFKLFRGVFHNIPFAMRCREKVFDKVQYVCLILARQQNGRERSVGLGRDPNGRAAWELVSRENASAHIHRKFIAFPVAIGKILSPIAERMPLEQAVGVCVRLQQNIPRSRSDFYDAKREHRIVHR